MVRKSFTDTNWEFPFILRCPKQMEKNLPIIIQLHGAGERGNGVDELDRVEVYGFSKVLTDEVEYPCLLVQPQCRSNTFWAADVQSVLRFVEQVTAAFEADRSRIYLTGISMGGFGTWFAAMARPKLFAAIAPCCGGGMPWNAGVLDMPIWAFHGTEDTVVTPRHSIEMVEMAQKTNLDVTLTLYEGVGHDSWHRAFSVELLEWLLSKHR